MKRCACLIWLLFFVPVRPALSEQVYRIGGSFDLVGALDNNPLNGFTPFRIKNGGFSPVYAVYPSIQLESIGPNFRTLFDYGFGFNRIGSESDLDSISHNLGMTLSGNLTRNLKVTFSDSYVRSPDITTLNLFRGTLSTPEGLFFPSDLVAVRRNSVMHTASLSVDYKFSPYSRVGFGIGRSSRHFAQSPDSSTGLSNQIGLTGNVSYTRAVSERTNWSVDYSKYQYQFEDFGNARSQNVDIGLSHQLRQTLLLRVSAGPSYAEELISRRNYVGFNGSFGLSKSFQASQISLTYSRRSGTSTGIGSLSDTQDVRVDYSHTLSRKLRLNVASWLYDTRQSFDDPMRSRGLSGAVILNVILGPQWTLNLGANYQRQQGFDFLDLERQRVFVSLKFNVPSFLRFDQ